MKIAIYSRKSKETETGQSITNQINMCKNYFKIYDEHPIFEIFSDDGFSGSNINRPAFKKLLSLAKQSRFDVIAVYKIDRIARNITDFFQIYKELEEHNVKLISITENFDASTAVGKMMMTMLAGFADMERENIRQRVTDNMHELAKIGRWSGGKLPFGYTSIRIMEGHKSNAYLQLDESMREKIISIYTLTDSFLPYQIAQKVNVSPRTVLSIIRNPVYMISDKAGLSYLKQKGFKVFGEANGRGLIAYNRSTNTSEKLIAVSKHEGCVSSKLWIAANKRLDARKEFHKPRTTEKTFLGNIAHCSCGAPLHIAVSRVQADGTRKYNYRCKTHRFNKEACDFISANCMEIEQETIKFLKKISKHKKILELYINTFNDPKKPTLDFAKKIRILKTKLNKIEKEITIYTEKILLVTGPAFMVVNNKLNELIKEREELRIAILEKENELIELNQETINVNLLFIAIKNKLKILENTNANLMDKQAAIRYLFKDIVISPTNIITFYFNAVIKE